MAPIFEDGNSKKDRPREGDLFETRSPAEVPNYLEYVLIFINICMYTYPAGGAAEPM